MFTIFKSLLGNNNSDLKDLFASKDVFLVDVRSAAEFASGSVKNAVNIPLDQIGPQISKLKNKKNIVVFCRSGNRSSMAKNILEKNGINDVTNGGSLQNMQKYIES
ncbi:rhodanese-like domain-containing protein [Flavobacterium sp. CBA20B-1]|uniref:rhodanese-like domain-containing protein n=1 Tax=unclassified Flavobacterium TaxID=196869 RepID=UPI002224F93C|nr:MULTISPECIES: rhodanese-like domain-containing protein [unclassified Flavobacterium]WCM42949.1 rhodanese-like domain-containing protein [Flavobacterium sp. CBA20B-1]